MVVCNHTHTSFLGIGGVIIAFTQLGRPETFPRWLSAMGLVGMLIMVGFGLTFALTTVTATGEFRAAIPLGFLSAGFIPAFAWQA